MVTCTFWNLENSGQRSLELNFKKHAPLYPKCKRNPAIKEEAASLECEPRELGGGRGLRARSLLSLAHSGPFTDMFLDQMFHVLQRSLQHYQGQASTSSWNLTVEISGSRGPRNLFPLIAPLDLRFPFCKTELTLTNACICKNSYQIFKKLQGLSGRIPVYSTK